MKLLAVVAIGVIALIGSPVLAETYPSIGKECGTVKDNADQLWHFFKKAEHSADIAADKAGPLLDEQFSFLKYIPDSRKSYEQLSEELKQIKEKRARLEERLEILRAKIKEHRRDSTELIRELSYHAQIYSAFCK